jgi:hypothetical protein
MRSAAHRSWNAMLNHQEFAGLLRANKFEEIAMRAVRIESRTNLIFSFEKMAPPVEVFALEPEV